MSKRALITGISGQDGSYLAELLLSKGYDVFGVTRRLSAPNLWRIEHLLDRIELRPGDLLDQLSLIRIISGAPSASGSPSWTEVPTSHTVASVHG